VNGLESSLHLYAPPRYRASDGSWYDAHAEAVRHSDESLTWDPAAVLSLLSFHYVCGDRTLMREIRRRPWLSSIGPEGDARLEPIPPHDTIWQSTERSAARLGSLLCDEALGVCQGRAEIYVLLSGGLDSRVVAGSMARAVREGGLDVRPVAVTWGLTDSRDYAYARAAAELLGFEWLHLDLEPRHLRENVSDAAALLGCLVSPLHLHRMTWFANVSPDAL
jgi:asparagine synthase (glutamine-hydrolysing)